ncbi:MAG: phytoene/squalene synthase family protein [Magnetovibrionaceae bacterium]
MAEVSQDLESRWLSDLRRHDRDRALCLLMAPDEVRADLIALAAFNLEIARIPEQVSEPILGQMRLQWWRDGLDDLFGGRSPRHPCAEVLTRIHKTHGLDRERLEAYLSAREGDLFEGGPADRAALEGYIRDTSGVIAGFSLSRLGLKLDEAAIRATDQAVMAFSIVGLIRALPFHAATRRLHLPADIMAEVGLSAEAIFAMKPSEELSAAVKLLAEMAIGHLDGLKASTKPPKAALPLVLQARFAKAYLKRLAKAGYDPHATEIRRQSSPWTLLGALVSARLGRV